MNHARLYNIMADKDRTLSAHAARLGLRFLQPAYRLAISLRNQTFDLHLRKPTHLPRPTISVGNLTTGGTGKTPMVIQLAKQLTEQGSHPAVLLRGYMPNKTNQQHTTSDEAQELACELGSSIPVQPNPNRAAAAEQVLSQHPDTDVFLLDDAFQHRQIHRDLDIVLIDATRPFGFDHLLPRGLLREPPKNLRRAHAIIITRCDLVPPQTLADLDQRIQSLTGQPPTAHAAYQWTAFRSNDHHLPGDRFPGDHLKNLKTVGLSAIGNPNAFQHMLNQASKQVLTSHSFDDHHAYQPHEVRDLLADAKQRGADAIVLTEKDWVKWQPILQNLDTDPTTLPILRPILGIHFLHGTEKISQLLQQTTNTPSTQP
jgi:tetraacyldisaccharide 4'-kinase